VKGAELEGALSRYEPFIVRSKNLPGMLFCALTGELLNARLQEVKAHMKGRKFGRARGEQGHGGAGRQGARGGRQGCGVAGWQGGQQAGVPCMHIAANTGGGQLCLSPVRSYRSGALLSQPTACPLPAPG